jgi:hypothetical protein
MKMFQLTFIPCMFLLVFSLFPALSGCSGPDTEYIPTSLLIEEPRLSDITTSTAKVSWKTDYDSWSRVQIIAPDSSSNVLMDFNKVREHSMQINRLEPDTSYLLIISSSNDLGGSSFETGIRLYFSTKSTPPSTDTSS